MTKTIRNEQRKLTAAFFNNIAAGSFLGGLFLPAWSFYQWLGAAFPSGFHAKLTSSQIAFNVAVVVAGIALAAGLHFYAQRILSKLED